MPKAARGQQTDSVVTNHDCDTIIFTDECSPDVLVNEKGVVRKDDLVLQHLFPLGILCLPHAPSLDTNFSTTVFANFKNVAFLGSLYGGNHEIITGSDNVFIGS
jgi:hypothetical protein